MPPIRNTGFIAKDTNAQAEQAPHDPFFILGIIFVVIAILVSIASYGAGMYYENDNQAVKDSIKNVTTNFNEKTINEMLNFYIKTIAVNGVLQKHTYPNSVFYTLEGAVEDSVYFRKFSFTNREEKGYEVFLNGVAPNYRSVAKQMDILKGDQYKNIFSNIDLKSVSSDQFGNLSFDITFNVDVRKNIKQTIIRSPVSSTQIFGSTSSAPIINITPTPTFIPAATSTKNSPSTSTIKTTNNPISL